MLRTSSRLFKLWIVCSKRNCMEQNGQFKAKMIRNGPSKIGWPGVNQLMVQSFGSLNGFQNCFYLTKSGKIGCFGRHFSVVPSLSIMQLNVVMHSNNYLQCIKCTLMTYLSSCLTTQPIQGTSFCLFRNVLYSIKMIF